MRHFATILTAAMITLALGQAASAQWTTWRPIQDMHRTKVWPAPFHFADRCAVRSNFAAMIHRGWQLENTIGDYHFEQETQRLNQAGRLKLRSIVLESAESRKVVFVLRGATPDVTATRIDDVQRAIVSFVPHGPLPDVLATDDAPRGMPADIVGRTYQARDAAQPAPVLPASGGSSGGGN